MAHGRAPAQAWHHMGPQQQRARARGALTRRNGPRTPAPDTTTCLSGRRHLMHFRNGTATAGRRARAGRHAAGQRPANTAFAPRPRARAHGPCAKLPTRWQLENFLTFIGFSLKPAKAGAKTRPWRTKATFSARKCKYTRCRPLHRAADGVRGLRAAPIGFGAHYEQAVRIEK